MSTTNIKLTCTCRESGFTYCPIHDTIQDNIVEEVCLCDENCPTCTKTPLIKMLAEKAVKRIYVLDSKGNKIYLSVDKEDSIS